MIRVCFSKDIRSATLTYVPDSHPKWKRTKYFIKNKWYTGKFWYTLFTDYKQAEEYIYQWMHKQDEAAKEQYKRGYRKATPIIFVDKLDYLVHNRLKP